MSWVDIKRKVYSYAYGPKRKNLYSSNCQSWYF